MSAPTTPAPTEAASLGSLPSDAISYEDLYARWERGNWCAMKV